jgi:hypothetical protein
VLLLSRTCDTGLDAVGELLARVGIPVLRLDADLLGGLDLVADPAVRTLRVDGAWFAPTVVWMRHFSAAAVDPADDFARAAWRLLAEQAGTCAAVTVQPPAPGLLDQLRVAAESGIAVPRTVVATDPRQAEALLPGPRLVVKALGGHFVEERPGELSGRFPVVVERGSLPATSGPPVVVQEYVEHEAELRVYAVRGEIHVFEVRKAAPSDPWLAPERVAVRAVRAAEMPRVFEELVAAVEVLSSAMALRYAAFDFLVRDGAPVFLEANADGDWRWVEERVGVQPVTGAVARMLAELHRSAGGSAPRGFDVMAFLGAGRR